MGNTKDRVSSPLDYTGRTEVYHPRIAAGVDGDGFGCQSSVRNILTVQILEELNETCYIEPGLLLILSLPSNVLAEHKAFSKGGEHADPKLVSQCVFYPDDPHMVKTVQNLGLFSDSL